MQIFNKGFRTIHASHIIKPKGYVNIEDEKEAEKLLKMYKNELIKTPHAEEIEDLKIQNLKLQEENNKLQEKLDSIFKQDMNIPEHEKNDAVENKEVKPKRIYNRKK